MINASSTDELVHRGDPSSMASGQHHNNGSETVRLLLSTDKDPEIKEVERGCGLDILKSIVYGGLLECIRSLSVISSAACSDASTLSVLGLGVAIMVSDLIIFAKNLRDLKKETNINSEGEVDPYEEFLGSRRKFGLHLTVSIVSFCLFGLIPPLVYFFSFSGTDEKTLKLVSAFLASLLCIVLLAIAEVCARNRPESFLDTVVNYSNLAIKSSAVYHLVRNLVPDLLKNEDMEQPQFKPDVQVPATKKNLTGNGGCRVRKGRKLRKPRKRRETDGDVNHQCTGESSNAKTVIKNVEGETERVLEEMHEIGKTHDLVCPNCNSCIANRVILKKKRRLCLQKPSTIILPMSDGSEDEEEHQDIRRPVCFHESRSNYQEELTMI